jgi:hypothetical protein
MVLAWREGSGQIRYVLNVLSGIYQREGRHPVSGTFSSESEFQIPRSIPLASYLPGAYPPLRFFCLAGCTLVVIGKKLIESSGAASEGKSFASTRASCRPQDRFLLRHSVGANPGEVDPESSSSSPDRVLFTQARSLLTVSSREKWDSLCARQPSARLSRDRQIAAISRFALSDWGMHGRTWRNVTRRDAGEPDIKSNRILDKILMHAWSMRNSIARRGRDRSRQIRIPERGSFRDEHHSQSALSARREFPRDGSLP